VVVRYGKDGVLKNSRPCNNCLEVMTNYNIKKVFYSTDNDGMTGENPKYMNKCHVSGGWKNYNSIFKN
tara:strand:- start:7126 stop:7329 length:204 start_codon:yes stop_codon:yes gene_type:complete